MPSEHPQIVVLDANTLFRIVAGEGGPGTTNSALTTECVRALAALNPRSGAALDQPIGADQTSAAAVDEIADLRFAA